MEDKEILNRIAEISSKSWREYGENCNEFLLLCQMLLCYPEHQEMLKSCLNCVEKCIEAKIDIFVLIKAGIMLADFPLLKLVCEDAKHRNEIATMRERDVLRDTSDLHSPISFLSNPPKYVPDERVAFARIYIERFLCSNKTSLDEELMAYSIIAYEKNADEKMLLMLRKRYYRFVHRFYGIEKKNAYDPASGFPEELSYNPIAPILSGEESHLDRIRKRHYFLLLNKRGDHCYLSYLKSKKQFWLRGGSSIVRNFNPSAKRCAKFIEDMIKQGDTLYEENQEYYRLKKSVQVSSPTLAASLVLGYNVYGGKKWHNKFGETLQRALKSKQNKKKESDAKKKKRAAAKRPKPPKQNTKVSSSKSS